MGPAVKGSFASVEKLFPLGIYVQDLNQFAQNSPSRYHLVWARNTHGLAVFGDFGGVFISIRDSGFRFWNGGTTCSQSLLALRLSRDDAYLLKLNASNIAGFLPPYL